MTRYRHAKLIKQYKHKLFILMGRKDLKTTKKQQLSGEGPPVPFGQVYESPACGLKEPRKNQRAED